MNPSQHRTAGLGRPTWVLAFATIFVCALGGCGRIHSAGAATTIGTPRALAFANPAAGWLATAHTLLLTTDGGTVWRGAPSPLAGVRGFDVLGPRLVWAYGRDGIARSTDGGKRWMRLSQANVTWLHLWSATAGVALMVFPGTQGAKTVLMRTRSVVRMQLAYPVGR